MKYTAELKPRAIKDLKSIPPKERERIVTRIERMEKNLQGDVKKLTNHIPEFGCGVGIIGYCSRLKETRL